MSTEKLQDAIGMVSDDLITEAKKKRFPRRKAMISAIAAVLVLVICVSIFTQSGYSLPPQSTLPAPPTIPADAQVITPVSPDTLGLANLVAGPCYPTTIKYTPYSETDKSKREEYLAWKIFQEEWTELYGIEANSFKNLNDFIVKSSELFLSGGGNQLYSPVSVYMALAMLAECTAGTSRSEILELFGGIKMDDLRQQAQNIWMAYYKADETTNCVFSNSIWLDNEFQYKPEVVLALSDFYFASVFSGDLQTQEMVAQLQAWVNAMTGDQLKEHTANLSFDPLTVFSLVSTINFRAEWNRKFINEFTRPGIFHSSIGDREVEYMHSSNPDLYYWGNNYAATYKTLTGEHKMWFLLPSEGNTPQDILNGTDWLTMVQNPAEWKNQKTPEILNLKVPKFDIDSNNNLVESLKKLGVKKVFSFQASDFRPINNADIPIAVSKIEHAVRVAIDEEGVSAAGYTFVNMLGGGNPEVTYLHLERPFLFVITTNEGLPLFVGIVDQP